MRIVLYLIIAGFCFFAHRVYAQETKDSIYKQYDLDAFEISVKKDALKTGGVQTYSLGLKSIERLPQLFGATDAIRTLQLLPGVQTVGEASSGLYIEGCNPSQNLVLLDHAPVFNPVHLGGFFSVFNNDHFNDFQLQKNFIPAEYGGRLAAVLTVNSKTDIPKKITSDANVSLLMSNATVRVPLNEKSAVALSGRISYVNPILGLLTPRDNLTPRSQRKAALQYNFYDFNLGYYYLHGRNEWKLSLYTGQDKSALNLSEKYMNGYLQWGNLTASLNWKHTTSVGSLNQTLYSASYRDDFSLSLGLISDVNFLSSLQEVGYKNHFSGETSKLKYSLGLDYLYR
ncbi:MAG: TonB-dependent receptor plug domain-containing protein, partial [Bacteroidales bacterium]|nr:TonB-dependent receptor plug domain-containing protein [Bacteroidales bacterium]